MTLMKYLIYTLQPLIYFTSNYFPAVEYEVERSTATFEVLDSKILFSNDCKHLSIISLEGFRICTIPDYDERIHCDRLVDVQNIRIYEVSDDGKVFFFVIGIPSFTGFSDWTNDLGFSLSYYSTELNSARLIGQVVLPYPHDLFSGCKPPSAPAFKSSKDGLTLIHGCLNSTFMNNTIQISLNKTDFLGNNSFPLLSWILPKTRYFDTDHYPPVHIACNYNCSLIVVYTTDLPTNIPVITIIYDGLLKFVNNVRHIEVQWAAPDMMDEVYKVIVSYSGQWICVTFFFYYQLVYCSSDYGKSFFWCQLNSFLESFDFTRDAIFLNNEKLNVFGWNQSLTHERRIFNLSSLVGRVDPIIEKLPLTKQLPADHDSLLYGTCHDDNDVFVIRDDFSQAFFYEKIIPILTLIPLIIDLILGLLFFMFVLWYRNSYDYFISYRQPPDQAVIITLPQPLIPQIQDGIDGNSFVHSLHNRINNSFYRKVFLDVFQIGNGENFRDKFVRGVIQSGIFIPIINNYTLMKFQEWHLNHPGLYETTVDNVLLEWYIALRCQDTFRYRKRIYPILLRNFQEPQNPNPQLVAAMQQFDQIPHATINTAHEYLRTFYVYLQPQYISVREIFTRLLLHQACFTWQDVQFVDILYADNPITATAEKCALQVLKL